MGWMMHWGQIEEQKVYIVCPVNERYGDRALYLGTPIGFRKGWEVMRLMEGCYAALESPEFVPLPGVGGTAVPGDG